MSEHQAPRFFETGSTLAATYHISGEGGRGGTSQLFGATNWLGNQFIIKAATGNEQRLLFKEAELYETMPDPLFPRFIELGLTEQNLSFIVMERIIGSNCHGQKFNLPQAIEIMMQVCGLERLHRQGWLHLDIKPSNIMVQADRTVRVIDLGAAEPIGPVIDNIVCSPLYCSPEQARDRLRSIQHFPIQVLTEAADAYAIGTTLFKLITHTDLAYRFCRSIGIYQPNLWDYFRAHADDKAMPELQADELAERYHFPKHGQHHRQVTERFAEMHHELRDLLKELLAKDQFARLSDFAEIRERLAPIRELANELSLFEEEAA